ncbi:MAG: hypothetical protein GQ570_12825 [Helicobacteraceae bacterium]|nr:hypothetical protein [Helicobacteraceae bacterium]
MKIVDKIIELKVPSDLVDLLNDKSSRVNLAITFSIKDDYSILADPIATDYAIGNLSTSIKNKATKNEKDPFYIFSIELGYIIINYFYNANCDVGLGSQWTASQRYVYLGLEYNSFEKLSDILNHNHTSSETLLYNLTTNLNKIEIEKNSLIERTINKVKDKDLKEFQQKLEEYVARYQNTPTKS